MTASRFARIALLAAAMTWGASSVYAHCGSCGVGKPKGSAAKSVESKGSGSKKCAGCAAKGSGAKKCSACSAKGSGSKTCAGCAAKGSGSKASGPDAQAARISPQGLNALIGAKTGVTVLDARGKDDGRSVPGSTRVSADSSDKDIAKAAPSKDALIVTYCGNFKCKASNKLATRLKKMGYKNIIEMPAGIDGWVASGLKAK